jgi:hypothetical protein
LSFHYFVFGLHLCSNLPLSGVVPSDSPAEKCDVELHLGTLPRAIAENPNGAEELSYVSADIDASGEPLLKISEVGNGAFVRLTYADRTRFWLDRERAHVWAAWPSELSLENTVSYVLGPVLGVLLRLRGVTCLHASAVSIGDRGVVFVGQAGSGKSTTAAAFARQGYGVISDDIVALAESEGAFYLMPAYPHLCLWPESVQMLYDSPEALPRLVPNEDKRRMSLGAEGTRFENRCLPLGAIYVLGERRPNPAPYVEVVRPQSSLLTLVADTYANKILDREMRAREFAVLGRLVTTVPIRRVHANADASKLKELCNLICEDFSSLDRSSSEEC